MASKRRPMELTLLEGTFDGPVRLKIPRRTYALYLMSRAALERWLKDPELNQAGIYMMLDEPNAERPRLYIGQASIRANLDGIINRIQEHLRQGRHSWTQYVVMLIADPQSFGATELNWLEHTFIRLASEAGRSHLDNRNLPSPGYIPEEIANDLTTTIADARLMIASMRLLFLEPALVENNMDPKAKNIDPYIHDTAPQRERESREFYMHLRGRSNPTIMIKSAGKWVLKAGSPINERENITYPQAVSLRNQHIDDVAHGIVMRDITFDSPNQAAVFVQASACQATMRWKDKNGIPLGEALKSGDLS